MPLPTPKIDPRTFDELVREVLGMVNRYNREWTRPARSDPGHALVEVFSVMTEMGLERFNRFPDKVFAEMLALIGMRLRLPVPATALATFTLSDAREVGAWVPKGTRVASAEVDDREPVIFETLRDVFVFEARLNRVCARVGDSCAVYEADLGFLPFENLTPVWDYLWIVDASLVALRGKKDLTLDLHAPENKGGDVRDYLSWEYFSATEQTWRSLPTGTLEDTQDADRKLCVIQGPIEELAPVVGISATEPCFALRARVQGNSAYPDRVRVADVKISLGTSARGDRPEMCLTSLGAGFFSVIDMASHFSPFGREPKTGIALYILAVDALNSQDSRVELLVDVSDSPAVKAARPSVNLILEYEYYDGTTWRQLGASTPAGTKGSFLPILFADDTRALSRSGKVAFNRPDDMQPVTVRDLEGPWIRVRVAAGDYGSKEAGGARPLCPPVLRRLRVRREQKPFAPDRVYFEHNYQREDWSERFSEGIEACKILRERPREAPALYFSLEPKPAAKPFSLFFRIEQTAPTESDGPLSAEIPDGHGLAWEFWNGRRWAALFPRDDTGGFLRSGSVDFQVPWDLERRSLLGFDGAWLRARFLGYGRDIPKLGKIQGIHLNSVAVQNRSTHSGTELGLGDGTPFQVLKFPETPVLDGPHVWVMEAEEPPKDQLREILRESGSEAIRQPAEGESGAWVLWKEVKTFIDSGPTSRHYVLDHLKGEIYFGDGKRGMPPGNRNRVQAEYRLGGGTAGNVSQGTITVLQDAVPYISSVNNPWPGLGGLDLGDLAQVFEAGPQLIKNRRRAVTAEDFQWLVRERFGEVARVRCFDDPAKEGRVVITVIPRPPEGDLTKSLIPGAQLVKSIGDHLSLHCQTNAAIEICPADFVNVAIELTLALRVSGVRAEQAKRQIETNIRSYLHCTCGGPQKKGWPFGRAVLPADVLRSLESVTDIDYIGDLRLSLANSHRRLDRISLGQKQLVYIARLDLIEVMGRT